MKWKGLLSRRSLLMTIGSLGGLAALEKPMGTSPVYAKSKEAVALAMVGDRWHSFDYIKTAFTKTLVKEAGITIDFTPDPALITQKTLKKYKLLIILCDGMTFPGGYTTVFPFMENVKIVSEPPVTDIDEKFVMWITPEQGKAIKEFVAGGGSAWFFHNSSYISSANKDFRDVEGALFTGHTEFRPYKMKVVNTDHPITQGINDFVVTEEQHYLIYDKDQKNVLMRSVNEEGLEYTSSEHGNQGATCESCWAYDYGKGRVCFMAPGHTIPTLWNPEYVKLQKNAVRWLLKEI